MTLPKVAVGKRGAAVMRAAEAPLNWAVRKADKVRGRVGLGGRKGDYDDEKYEFVGGTREELRKKHYDKSMRLLWKAEKHAPWSSLRDMSSEERSLEEMALRSLTEEEAAERKRLTSPAFREMLDREYTQREKQAIVAILSAIGHGEAYAWLTSAEVLRDVKSTGAKSALTMQVVEEAKHFIVLRELVRAFNVDIPRLTVWEYVLLERVLKSKGLEKMFGMNVLVEGFALTMFGMMCELPGLEILRLFHLDESRHCALPKNYFRELPMSRWQRFGPRTQVNRLLMLLPAIPLVISMDEDLGELGIDAFTFGGTLMNKVGLLADGAGFKLMIPRQDLAAAVNVLFNIYCAFTRKGHRFTRFDHANTTRMPAIRQVEDEALGATELN